MPGTPVVLVGMKKDLRQSVAATNSLVPEDIPGQVAKTIGKNPFYHRMIILLVVNINALCWINAASGTIYITNFRSHCLL